MSNVPESERLSIDEYDAREQKHRHDMEKQKAHGASQVEIARARHKEERQRTVRFIGLGVVAASLIFGGIFLIVQANTGPNEGAAREQQREESCIANGGGWVPDDLLLNASEGMCVYPGKRAS
jgi:hypothetical protein